MSSKPPDQTSEGAVRDGGADGSLGEQLRRARIARGISLREISDQTRITMRHLEAIETNQYKNLPGGIFNRSFIRAFARAVNFDEKSALDLYARELRERGENLDDVATSPHRSRVYTDGDAGRSPALTFALSALLVGILCLGIYALWYAYDRRFGSSSKQANTQAVSAQTNPAQAATPTPAPDTLTVKVKAGDRVWVKTLVDGEREQDKAGVEWQAGREETYTPSQKLILHYSRDKAGDLEVTINDARATVPSNVTPGKIQQRWEINKDNWRQFVTP